MNDDEILEFEDELREVEKKLESLGRKICSVPNGADSFFNVNKAISCVEEAIHYAYKMRV